MPQIPSDNDELAVGVSSPDWSTGPSFAVNLFDLFRIPETIRDCFLLADKLDKTEAVITDRNRLDEGAVRFICDIITAASIVDTIRKHDKATKQYPTRCYVRHGNAWEKIPGNIDLVIKEGEKVVLNPVVFRIKPKGEYREPPPRKSSIPVRKRS